MIQTALTLALLVGAGLLIRTIINVLKVQSGSAVLRKPFRLETLLAKVREVIE